jgi:ABC transporter with metal-binding/Fe-S-binding domain ATP-binding protein
MRVAVLFTGGKDSTYAAYEALESGLKVEYLLTMVSKNLYPWMFHTININITRCQAEAMGIKQLMRPTSGGKNKELENLKEAIAIVRNDIDGVVAGAISSSYQKDRINHICEELELASIAPLWGRDPVRLLRGMLEKGFKIIITSVAAQGLDQNWLGKELNENTVEELIRLNKRYGINPSGEGGEYESLVLDAPFFRKKIEVVEAEKIWRGTYGYYFVKKARLVEK